MAALLTVREKQGQTVNAVPSVTVGIDQARRNTVPKGVTLRASFFMHGTSSMVGREGCYAEQRSVAHAGSLFRSLVGPHGSPPVYDQRTDGDYTKPSTESIIMANATHKGAIRPKSTQSRISANGTTDTITWVREATCIKRLRRFLAKTGCTLHISREGSADRQRHGELYIRDQEGRLIDDKINLESWLRAYDLLAGDEMIDPPLHKAWRFYVARSHVESVNGITVHSHRQLTRAYVTPEAARKAAEGIEDREELILVGYDASRQGGTHDGSL